MTQDARFQDGVEKPLYIGAIDPADIEVMSAFLQDAVVPVSEMKWRKQHRQLAVLLNRFRWEDKDHAQQQSRPVERVQSLLVIDHVRHIASIGIDRSTPKAALALLSLSYQEGEGALEDVQLTFSGSAAIKIQISALEISLRDVTNLILRPRVPYLLISFKPVLGLRLGLRVANCYAKVGAQNASFSRHSRRRF